METVQVNRLTSDYGGMLDGRKRSGTGGAVSLWASGADASWPGGFPEGIPGGGGGEKTPGALLRGKGVYAKNTLLLAFGLPAGGI